MNERKIILLCQHFYPEMVSTGLHMTELSTKLVALNPNNDIQVFCATPSKEGFRAAAPTDENYRGVQIRRMISWGKEHQTSLLNRLLFGISYFVRASLFTFQRRQQTDLLIVTTNPPFIGLIAVLMQKIFKKPYLLITHDIYPEIAVRLDLLKPNSIVTKFWGYLTRIIFENATQIVVIGRDMQTIVANKIAAVHHPKLQLIPNWSDSKEIFPVAIEKNRFIKQNNLEGKKIILYSGNMGRTHNIEPLLEAAQVLEKRSDIVFVFIGSGEKRKKVEQYIQQKQPKNVLMLPYQPFEILSDVLSSATISAVCLEDEFTGYSVPSKTYGCMAARTPILGLLKSDSEIGLTIEEFDCGRIFNSQSTEKLSDIIVSMIDNPQDLRQKAANSYQAFLAHFDLSISVQKYEHLIDKIVT